MKMNIRFKYMLSALWDLICGIGGFLLHVGVPAAATFAFLTLMAYIPWWTSILIAAVVILVMYLWIHADIKYKEDFDTSRRVIYDKYEEITRIWYNMASEGKSARTIYGLLTPMIDEFDTLLEYHKKLYGEDEIYKSYCERVDTFVKAMEDNERAELQKQEKLAAQLKDISGNAMEDIII